MICLLLGSTTPIPADQLATLYPSADDYLQKYTAATDAAIGAGFALQDDRDAMLDDAEPVTHRLTADPDRRNPDGTRPVRRGRLTR